MALVNELADARIRMVTHAHGVWVFDWHPPAGVTRVRVPGLAPIAAWTTPGSAGLAVLAGHLGGWHVSSTGHPGYVVSGLAWQAWPRRYQATVRLSSTGPVNVEIWDDNDGRLLTRRMLPATGGIDRIIMPVDATVPYRAHLYAGWGPFRANFISPPVGQRLELRVWSPGRETVRVYGATLTGLGAASR